MLRRLQGLGLLLSLCIGMTSCALIGGPDLHDLRFASLSIVDPSNSADTTNPWPNRVSLVVNFTAERDLAAYAKKYEYHIGNDTSFCRGSNIDATRRLQNDPYVFDTIGTVDAFREAGSSEKDDRAVRTLYHIYLAIRTVQLAGQNIFDYDLRLNPEDVCIQLRGGNMLGARFVSNTIVIPKALIIEALPR